MLPLAKQSDLETIYKLFRDEKEYFGHVRKDQLERRIKQKQVIYHNGAVIIYHNVERTQIISTGSNVSATRGDCILHQIVSKVKRKGRGSSVMRTFIQENQRNVFLSIRQDNMNARKFYETLGMKIVGSTSWGKNNVSGKIYFFNIMGQHIMGQL